MCLKHSGRAGGFAALTDLVAGGKVAEAAAARKQQSKKSRNCVAGEGTEDPTVWPFLSGVSIGTGHLLVTNLWETADYLRLGSIA